MITQLDYSTGIGAQVVASTSDTPEGTWSTGSLSHLACGDIEAWARVWELPRGGDGRVSRFAALRLIWNQPGLRATLLFRLSFALWRSRIPVLPGMLHRLNLFLHGLDIPACVEIGRGLYIPHPVGTVVMARRIGENVTLVSGITLGQRERAEFPTLGDGVYVGAGARILGAIHIGDGARIGANGVVLKDVPEHATAVGVPARILPPRSRVE